MNQNELISKKHKKVYSVFNYVDHLPIVISTITRCVSIFAFASLVGIPQGIASSAIRLKSYVITGGIKMCKWII